MADNFFEKRCCQSVHSASSDATSITAGVLGFERTLDRPWCPTIGRIGPASLDLLSLEYE
jgi:hypothetical protein